jgi:hypothetical protein
MGWLDRNERVAESAPIVVSVSPAANPVTLDVIESQGRGAGLTEEGRQNQPVGEAWKHQVAELPPIEAHVIEYQCMKAPCPDCGYETRAELPEEARSQTGPRLTALIA